MNNGLFSYDCFCVLRPWSKMLAPMIAIVSDGVVGSSRDNVIRNRRCSAS